MCGLTGVFGMGASRVQRRRAAVDMVRAICHRGPDDEGLQELRGRDGTEHGTFGHRRLAILDLSPQGHQPMLHRSGRYTLIFNGEIYNFLEIRDELRRTGATFRSDSDTEVILEGWARMGERFLPRLRGMFAFALWDSEEERGYLVRDPFGIKPLYVATTAGAVLFSSEVRSLLASGMVAPTIEPQAVAGYLAAGSVPEPLTAIAGIRALPPGVVTTVELRGGDAVLGAPRVFGAALSAPAGAPERSASRAAARVREALTDSVAHHLVSDVPVALFLSGGIDSSAVVAMASEVAREPLHTFTVTFDEAEFSEAGPAAAVAKRFGTDHREVPLSAADLLASLPGALSGMDQPSLDGLNTYAVSTAVRRAGYKVVLSGLGGDELFAGYPSFRRARRLEPLWRAMGPVRDPARRMTALLARGDRDRLSKIALSLDAHEPARAAYVASRSLLAGPRLAELLGAAQCDAAGLMRLPAPPEGLSLLQRVSWFELTGYMRNTLLRDSDVFSMAHGLELRVPFLDSAVAAAAMAADDSLKLASGRSKPLLLDAVADLLPREVWDRPKRGFELPFERWLRAELREEVAGVLTSPARIARVGLDASAVRRLWDDFLAHRPGVSWSRPWAVFTLIRWAEQLGVEVARSEDGPGRGYAAPPAADAALRRGA